MTSKDDFNPQTIPFEKPRPLTDGERELVEWLVAQADFPELRTQFQTVRAVGYCDCGCPSIALETDGPAVPPDAMRAYNTAQLEALRRTREDADEILGFNVPPRDDWFDIRAETGGRRRRAVEVVLHVPNGLMFELEIWTGDVKQTRVGLPTPSALSLTP